MARPPKGKPLTYRPIRLDDEVFAECQRLGKEYGTINEGMRVAFGWKSPLANQGRVESVVREVAARKRETWKRGIREKGDKGR